ncbi:MAG: hypothetical protein GTO18_05315 [Anaerolineales bacterium]|nr:hypothetical protein [Anaerolineales bacterium]
MKSKSRPRSVTWLAVGVLIFSAVFIIRMAVSLTLPDLPLAVPKWYLTLTGLIWGIAGLVGAYGLYSGRSWAPWYLRIGSLVFVIWYWADRMFLVQSEYERGSLLAAAFVTIAGLIIIFWILSRPGSRMYFQETYP